MPSQAALDVTRSRPRLCKQFSSYLTLPHGILQKAGGRREEGGRKAGGSLLKNYYKTFQTRFSFN